MQEEKGNDECQKSYHEKSSPCLEGQVSSLQIRNVPHYVVRGEKSMKHSHDHVHIDGMKHTHMHSHPRSGGGISIGMDESAIHKHYHKQKEGCDIDTTNNIYNKVICLLCNKRLRQVNGNHLLKVHGLSAKEYREMFPNSVMFTEDVHIHMSLARTGEKNPMYGSHRIGELNPHFGYHNGNAKMVQMWADSNSIFNSPEFRKNMRDIPKKLYGSGELVIWNKGLTKESDPRVKKYGQSVSLAYLDGRKKLPSGTGRGTKIRFEWDNRSLILRSTYELVVAIYYRLRNWAINYEDTKVSYNGHTCYSDFRFGKRIYEVKGYMDDRAILQRDAFIDNGYSHVFILKDRIIKMMRFIVTKGIDIKYIVEKAKEYRRKGEVFLYKYEMA